MTTTKRVFAARYKVPYLRAWRASRLMSQKELSALSGVVPNTIISIERGNIANAHTIKRLAAALGIEPAALLNAPEK